MPVNDVSLSLGHGRVPSARVNDTLAFTADWILHLQARLNSAADGASRAARDASIARWTTVRTHSPSSPLSDTICRVLALVTSRDCAQSSSFRRQLDEALRVLEWPPHYEIVDAAALQPTDCRLSYPVPTLLWCGRDVFGLEARPAPYPGAT